MLVCITLAVAKGLLYIAIELGLVALLILTVWSIANLAAWWRRGKEQAVQAEMEACELVPELDADTLASLASA